MASVAAVAVMLLVGALWNLTSLCERVADAEWERDKLLHARTDVPALVAEVRRLTAALATARREGAEEMRAAAVAACEGVAKQHQRTREGHRPYVADSTRQWVEGIEKGADLCACFLRALPLDAPGGAT